MVDEEEKEEEEDLHFNFIGCLREYNVQPHCHNSHAFIIFISYDFIPPSSGLQYKIETHQKYKPILAFSIFTFNKNAKAGFKKANYINQEDKKPD